MNDPRTPPEIPREIPREIPQAAVTEPPARRRRLSPIWLVPLLAIVISAGLALRNYVTQGPLVEIAFQDAAGIAAGTTELRYRNVVVGLVERVSFSEGLGSVLVGVRVTNDIAPYIDADARFWVVRPEVTPRGVTGLQTVLSGVYIEGVWNLDPGGLVERHEGLAAPPLVEPGREGLRLTLTTEAGEGLNAAAPILYKGLEVGRVSPAALSEDGLVAVAEAVVFAPYDRFVTEGARFWDASGFSVSLGLDGARVDFATLATILSGGVAFDQGPAGGAPAAQGSVFRVHPDEAAARDAMGIVPGEESLLVQAVFEGEVGALNPGAAVELGRLRVGRVVSASGLVDPARFGDAELRLAAVLEIQPSRLGLEPGTAPAEFLGARVEAGLRARLASASFLTGGLKVELIEVADAPPAALDEAAEPYPALPTAPSELPDVAASATGFLDRVSALPLEGLVGGVTELVLGAAALVNSPDLQASPAELRGVLADLRAVTGSQAVQSLPERVDAAARDLQLATAEASALLSSINEQDGAERLLAAVDRAGEAAAALGAAAEGAPEAVEGIAALVADLREPLPSIAARADAILASVAAITEDEATQRLPEGVALAIDEFSAILTEFRALDILTAFADAALAAEEAATSTEETARDFAAASQGLPDLIAELQGVASDVRALPIAPAVTQLTVLLASLDAILSQDAARSLPAALSQTAAELGALVADLREAQAAESLASALDAANAAAADVARATEGVPEIVENLQALSATARELPLEALVAQAAALVESADAVVGQEGAQALPGALAGALAEVEGTLADLRAGGTVEAVNETLASARAAAEGVAGAAGALPALVARIDTVIGQAQSTLATYGGDAAIPRDVRTALRSVQQAADSVASLARAIERRPSSLILGR